VDHPDLNQGDAADALRLVFDFTVTDRDGDTATDAFQVDIRDSVPTPTDAVLEVEVAEAGVGSPATVAGSLAAWWRWGRQARPVHGRDHRSFASLLSLTSNGEPLAYKIERDALVARAGANGPVGVHLPGRPGHGRLRLHPPGSARSCRGTVLGESRIPAPVSALDQPGDVFAVGAMRGDPFRLRGRLPDGDVIMRVTNAGEASAAWTMLGEAVNGKGAEFTIPVTVPAGQTIFVNIGQIPNNTRFDLEGDGLRNNVRAVVNPGKDEGIVFEAARPSPSTSPPR
jgi:hypothetical protein